MLDYFLSQFNSFSLDTRGLTPENLSSRSKREFHYSPDSKILVVGMPAWGQSLRQWMFLKKWAKKSGVSFLAYSFPREIFSNNQILTSKIFNLVNLITRKDIRELKSKYNFRKCVLVGVSLGVSYGSMIYKNNPDITEVLLVGPGNNLAQNMWSGFRTFHFKKSYQKQGIELADLESLWYGLSAENNLPARGTKVIILYGRGDKVISYRQSKKLAEILKKNSIEVNVKKYFLGHYLLVAYFLIFPDKFLNEICQFDLK